MTIIAVIGIIPYISLQLKGISNSYIILTQYPEIVMPQKLGAVTLAQDTGLWVAMILAAFTIAFGTRHLDSAEHHEGMVAAIAFESLVKLLAFLAVGVFVTFGVYNGFGDLFGRAAGDPKLSALIAPLEGVAGGYASWVWLTILSMFAIMFLPRQFQVTVIENTNEKHLNKAIWLFPLYMLAINIFVLPIAFGGGLHFPLGRVDADTFVLTVPMAEKQEGLALLAFIGGLSAATGMVIVETIALSTMVCNDLVMPMLLRLRGLRLAERADLTWLLLGIRRGAIVLILLLGYLYFKIAGEAYALVSIGLISFAAVAQFAPVALGGLFWRGGTRNGALAGLLIGFAVWFYTLLVPALARSGWLPIEIMQQGLFGFELLRPLQLFGLIGPGSDHTLDDMEHDRQRRRLCAGVTRRPSERGGAPSGKSVRRCIQARRRSRSLLARYCPGTSAARHAVALPERNRGQRILRSIRTEQGPALATEELIADGELVHYVETQLAGAIGAASARIMMASTVQEDALTLEDVREVLTEAQQVVMYSQQLEQKSKELEAATAELKNANERLQELDRMKDDFVSTVSHELRTPLTSIRAFSEILRENPEIGLTERKRFLDIISKESERLTRLINQVLDLAKIESGKLEWNVSEVDLREAITDSVNATSQLFHEKAVRVELHMPAHVPRVTTDFDRIIQVLINLLSNAGKFCDPVHGRVEVRLTHEGGKLRVDVRDNGKGISPRDQAIIFEKFGQAGDTLTDKPQGTGLGLPISRQIVEHFGGRLWVESALGKGATFSFTLPIETTEPAEEELLARLAQ